MEEVHHESLAGEADVTIRLRDVQMAYRRGDHVCPVLNGADFSVARGESVLLMGPSGCGKSTLLSIVGCILRPDRGRVSILGQEVTSLDEEGRAIFRRESIGFVFQRFHLIRGLSALDNVAVPLSLCGRPLAESQRRSRELLSAVGLADKASNTSAQLSAGQCQRVAIARALACDPDIILADEPTASLDAESGQSVMEVLSDLTKLQNKSLVVVTHDERIIRFADRVCVMRDGKVSKLENTATEPAVTL